MKVENYKKVEGEVVYPQYALEADALDILIKYILYTDYFCKRIDLNNSIIFSDAKNLYGLDTPDFVLHGTSFHIRKYKTPVMSFEDFINLDERVVMYDNGKDWKEKGRGCRWQDNPSGLFEWYKNKKHLLGGMDSLSWAKRVLTKTAGFPTASAKKK